MENLYTLIMRAVLVAAGILALAAGATALTMGSPQLLVWVGFALASGWYASSRLRRVGSAVPQTKSRAMSS